jgi:hypothetical protein
MTQKYRVVLASLSLSIMVSGSTFSAFAQTGDIDPTGVAPTACVNLSTSLRYRDTDNATGGAVSNLQEFLISKGYMNTEATGFFGPITFASVKKYQAAKGLTTSGFVGDYTRAAIKADSCNGSSSTSTTSSQTSTSQTTTAGTASSNSGPIPSGYIISQGNEGTTCSIVLGRSVCYVTVIWTTGNFALSPKPVALVSCESNGGACTDREERYEGINSARSFMLRNGIQRIFSIIGYDFSGNLRKVADLSLQAQCASGSVWGGTSCVLSNGSGYTAVTTTTTSNVGTSPTSGALITNYDVKSDGRILTSMTVTIKGGGPNLRACSGKVMDRWVFGAGQKTPCDTDTEFVYLKNQPGWSYAATTDTYSFNGSLVSSALPDTAYFTKFILTDGSRVEKSYSSSNYTNGTTLPALPACASGNATCSTASTAAAKVLVSNSPTGPFVVYAYNKGKIYVQTTGLIKSSSPKGCLQPSGLSTCLNSANHREFTSSEWANDTTVITSVDAGVIPSDYYESYIMYPGQTPVKIGSFSLYMPVPEIAISNSPNGPWGTAATNSGKVYVRTSGLLRSANPKGCFQPSGAMGCVNESSHREYTSSEWANDTTVITSFDGGTFPNSAYDGYVSYPGRSAATFVGTVYLQQ